MTSGDRLTRATGVYYQNMGGRIGVYGKGWTVPLSGRQFHYQVTNTGLDQCLCVDATLTWDGTISEDGNSIVVNWEDKATDGSDSTKTYTYYRQ